MEKIRVVLYGVGAVGSRIAKFLLEKGGIEIGLDWLLKSLSEVLCDEEYVFDVNFAVAV